MNKPPPSKKPGLCDVFMVFEEAQRLNRPSFAARPCPHFPTFRGNKFWLATGA
jgi:hypothetical protein